MARRFSDTDHIVSADELLPLPRAIDAVTGKVEEALRVAYGVNGSAYELTADGVRAVGPDGSPVIVQFTVPPDVVSRGQDAVKAWLAEEGLEDVNAAGTMERAKDAQDGPAPQSWDMSVETWRLDRRTGVPVPAKVVVPGAVVLKGKAAVESYLHEAGVGPNYKARARVGRLQLFGNTESNRVR